MRRGLILLLLVGGGSFLQAEETTDSLIDKMLKQEKLLLKRRAQLSYTVVETREKLDGQGNVKSSSDETMSVRGVQPANYGPSKSEGVEADVKKVSKEEPFNILNIIHHYNFTLVGSETVDGFPCYKIHFEPKRNQPFHNRNEKVANELAGFLWISRKDYSLVRNEGKLTHSVSVAWFFSTLRELEFSFEARPIFTGEFAPRQIQYRFKVQIMFVHIHERHIRKMSRYHPTSDPLPEKEPKEYDYK